MFIIVEQAKGTADLVSSSTHVVHTGLPDRETALNAAKQRTPFHPDKQFLVLEVFPYYTVTYNPPTVVTHE